MATAQTLHSMTGNKDKKIERTKKGTPPAGAKSKRKVKPAKPSTSLSAVSSTAALAAAPIPNRAREINFDAPMATNNEAGWGEATAIEQPAKKKRGKPFEPGNDPRRNLKGRPKGRTFSEAMRAMLEDVPDLPENANKNTYAELLAWALLKDALNNVDVRSMELIRRLTEPDRFVFDWRGKARQLGLDPDAIAEAAHTAVNNAGGDSGGADAEGDEA